MPTIAVGVLKSPQGLWIEQRSAAQHLAGSWAFPGGKVEPGEAPRAALRRELAEELHIRAGAMQWLIDIPWHYPGKTVFLRCYHVKHWQGEIHAGEQQQLRAQSLTAANRNRWLEHAPAANAGLINALLLPKLMRITPAIHTSPQDWIGDVEQRAQMLTQPALIQLRPQRPLALPMWQALAAKLTAAGHWVLLNAGSQTPELLQVLDPQSGRLGVHIKQDLLPQLSEADLIRWQKAGGLLSTAVHDQESLTKANRLGMDLITASPIKPTKSHPGVSGRGWRWFASIAQSAVMPVYALGGVGPADYLQAHRHRGFGVAGIRACWEEQHGYE